MTLLALVTYYGVAYLFGAFCAWDWGWLNGVPNWLGIERAFFFVAFLGIGASALYATEKTKQEVI